MKIHELKVEPRDFQAIIDELKLFKVLKNDRDYMNGDILFLREWKKGMYTGRKVRCVITYVSEYENGLLDGYVILNVYKVR